MRGSKTCCCSARERSASNSRVYSISKPVSNRRDAAGSAIRPRRGADVVKGPVRVVQSMCAPLCACAVRGDELEMEIHFRSSGRTSVKRYVTRSGKCVHIPPPLSRKRPANEAVAQTLVLLGFVVRGGIDDLPSILSTRR